jgi:hypothetical protein
MPESMKLILYSKPGCHLCEGLTEKLQAITALELELDIRDITSRADWLAAYEYEIPVLLWQSAQGEVLVPRSSPRTSVTQLTTQLTQLLQRQLEIDR